MEDLTPSIASKPPTLSAAESHHLVLPSDTNALGTTFGGRVMEWIDLIGAIVATRHCRQRLVTASMDALHFISSIRLGDIAVLKASVNYTHRTSIEVGVRVESEDPETGVRRHTASAYLTFVAIDSQGRPSPVPPLLCETEDEKQRFEAGKKRRELRLQQKKS